VTSLLQTPVWHKPAPPKKPELSPGPRGQIYGARHVTVEYRYGTFQKPPKVPKSTVQDTIGTGCTSQGSRWERYSYDSNSRRMVSALCNININITPHVFTTIKQWWGVAHNLALNSVLCQRHFSCGMQPESISYNFNINGTPS